MRAASFAFLSAISLPSIPECHGILTKLTMTEMSLSWCCRLCNFWWTSGYLLSSELLTTVLIALTQSLKTYIFLICLLSLQSWIHFIPISNPRINLGFKTLFCSPDLISMPKSSDWHTVFLCEGRTRSSARGSRRPCSSADDDKVPRTCIRRRRSGGMKPVAVLRSQVLRPWTVSRRRWRHFSSLLTFNSPFCYPRVAACTVWTIVYGALESVAVLWRLRIYRFFPWHYYYYYPNYPRARWSCLVWRESVQRIAPARRKKLIFGLSKFNTGIFAALRQCR